MALIVPSMNATTGFINGGISEEPTDNNCTSITNGSVSLVNLALMFKFYTSSDASNNNRTSANLSNWTALAKIVRVNAFINGSVGDGHSGNIGIHQAMKKLALAVFGSELSVDFFTNSSSLIDSYAVAFQELQTQVNSVNTTDATYEVGNALIFLHPERFLLKYNAVCIGGTIGTYTNKTVNVSGVDTGARVTVVLNSETNVVSITVTTVTSFFIVPGFGNINKRVRAGNSITIVGGGGSANVTIASINSVQAAILNGLLTNTIGTSLPFEAGDTFRVQYLINPNPNQINGSGELISASIGKYQAFMNFVAS